MEIHRILSLSQLLSSLLVNPSHPFKHKFDLNCSFARPKYSKRHINLDAIYGYYDPGANENGLDKEKFEELHKEDEAQPSLFEREKENIDPELSDLISKQYEIQKNTNCTERLSKYDWFDDEPLDSSDEEFAIEYCETKVPDMNAIYKTLDPYGIRNYLPKNLTMADRSLGRVYDVGKPISEVIDKNETEEDEFLDLNYNGTGEFKEKWDPNMVADEPMQELDFGEFEDPEEEDIVMEDELCRYFVKLPMTKWTNIEGEAYNRDAEKFNRSNTYYKKIKIDHVITDFRTVFNSPIYSDIGIKDNQQPSHAGLMSGSDTDSGSAGQADAKFNDDASEKVALVSTSKLHALYIMEYKHNDLLNDIDSYERSEYPKLVDQLVNEDSDKPTFTFRDNITRKDDSNVEIGTETSIYIGVPKDIIKPDEEGSTIVNDSLLLRRNYTETVGKVIDNIPIKEQYHTAILILPNELGYRDQNIRYLADELSINTNSIVFMPEISEDPVVYQVTLNRVIKFIQLGFNVDRLCIVALGNQGARIVNYLHQTMVNVVSLYHQKDFTYGPKITDLHLKRYHDLTKRHTAPMIEDIIYACTNSDSRTSAVAADRARDFNTIKPLSKILQSVILFDPCNVNIIKMVQISTPILALLSNRNKLLEDFLVLNEDPDFIKQRDRVIKGHKMRIINAFKYCNEKKPDNLQELVKDIKLQILPKSEGPEYTDVDLFRILSKNKGVDISINIYRHGSGYFYMKKPTADKRELKAIGASIMLASNWIRCWTT